MLISSQLFSQILFDDFFENKTLRVDFILAGDAVSESAFLMDVIKEPFWGGTQTKLIDPFDYGEYRFEVIDKASQKRIYTKGFCTFFEEWQTIREAEQMERAFYEVITFPLPKNKIVLNIYSRKWEGNFEKILSTEIDPNSYLIKEVRTYNFKTEKLVDNGEPKNKVDIAFLAEGYTKNEMDKFKEDVKRMMKNLTATPPFDETENKINVWIVNSISEDSGSDIPGDNVWKNTILNSSFYTFDSERYLTSQDYKTIRDVASLVPYDQIYVLVNTNKYGGGGIYNHYNLTSVDHSYSEIVFVHEFGHGFAGLADEYYDGSTSYEDYVNIDVEPWQPNITTLKNFDAKWKNMLNDSVKIPTKPVMEYAEVVGVYEGASYTLKGVYRPYINCRMKTNEAKGFCPVCKKAILDMFQYYCSE